MSVYRRVALDPTAYVSPQAGVVGDVRVGPLVSIFAGAQLRGDDGQYIQIGASSNIQENAIIHVGRDHPTVVGERVTVGHGAILHGCTVDDDALIGMGAIVLDGARIRSGCLVGAGALVTAGKDFPENSLIIGSPARAVRTLSAEEIQAQIVAGAQEYVEVAQKMADAGLMRRGSDFADGVCGYE